MAKFASSLIPARFSLNCATAATLLALSLGLSSLVGCTSTERFSYASTTYAPQTVTLVNTATGENIWSCDIPPGQKLELRFTKTARAAEEAGSDEMAWTLIGQTDQPAGRRSTMKVPPPSHRRLDLTQREAPEGRNK